MKTIIWTNKMWDELTNNQRESAQIQYAKDTGDEAKYASSADWYVNQFGEVQASPNVPENL